jgi:cytochrome c-type biogenesis protein CcmH
MIVFWLIAAALLALALLLVLPTLFRQRAAAPAAGDAAAPDARRANLAILRDQLAQIDAELAAGGLSAEQHRLSRGEIERRVLDEESVTEGPRQAGPARRTAMVLGAVIPLFALGVYAVKGNIPALDPLAARAPAAPGGEVTMAQVEEMVEKLAKKLEGQTAPQPGDAQGWTMLARSYAFLQRLPEASRAYGRALALEPRDAQLLADHADVLAALQGQQLAGEPMRLIEQALQIDPNHPKALALAGSAAFERKEFAAAISLWTKARQFVPADSEFAKALDGSIAEAKGASQGGAGAAAATQVTPAAAEAAVASTMGATAPSASTALAAASAPAATGAGTGVPATAVTGRVSLAPALAARAAPTDTVFIFARAADGPRMPLAILKRTVADLPISFTLDDSMAMSPQTKLSSFPLVVVGARVSKSGNAMPQAGDLQGQAPPVKIGSSGIELVIDAVQP